ncbi:MAG: Ldh family oxidoreductase [Candidatus Bathyarchaeia archaeon]
MSFKIVSVESLKTFCIEVLRKLNVPFEDAEITADAIISADLRGIESHGVARLHRYAKRLMNGWIKPESKLTVLKETPISLLIDAENSLGQVAAYKAMKLCINKAEKNYFGVAVVKNSNHFGVAGYYAMMALKNNMIGICMSNASPLVLPTFGIKPILGTNPIAIAVPTKYEPPLVLDMATSVVSIGKIELYRKFNKLLPVGWAVNDEGNIELNAEKVINCVYQLKRGGLLPLGGLVETSGYKGYGLAMIIDVLTGVLSGAAYGSNVGGPNDPKPSNIGHFLAAININAFMDVNEFKERINDLINIIKNSDKMKGYDKIYIPGEKEWEIEKQRKEKGIPLSIEIIKELKSLANQLSLNFPL